MNNTPESLFTGIPELETFLSKLHSNETVDCILYENGNLIIKLKTDCLADSNKTQQFLQLITSYPELNKYIKRVPTQPCKESMTTYYGAEYHLRHADLKAANPNLIDNLKAFVSTLEKLEDVEKISQGNKETIIIIKQEVMTNQDRHQSFLKLFYQLSEKLKLRPYLQFKATKPLLTETIQYSSIEYHIDLLSFLTSYHTSRLKSCYALNKDDLAKSMNYLIKAGWDERQFYNIGVSRATFYRYKSEKQEKA